jgi:hypothetical protein
MADLPIRRPVVRPRYSFPRPTFGAGLRIPQAGQPRSITDSDNGVIGRGCFSHLGSSGHAVGHVSIPSDTEAYVRLVELG